MKKGITIIILILMVLGCTWYFLMPSSPEKKKDTDIEKFINEYEKYNNKKNEAGKAYPTVNIEDYTPVIYSSSQEILKFIKNGTGVIYFGNPVDPWSRSALPIFLKALFNSNIDKLLYLDITNIQSTITAQNGEPIVEKKGTSDYYQLLTILDSYLSPYNGVDENMIEVDFNEKRLYQPTFIFVDKGQIIGLHELTVESQKDGFTKLTKEEETELYQIYFNYISQMSSIECGSGSAEEC